MHTSVAALFARAEYELTGVGDAALGEWREVGALGVVHLRRRLSVDEAERVGPVVDVRGTWEATKRLNRMRRYLPLEVRLTPTEDLP